MKRLLTACALVSVAGASAVTAGAQQDDVMRFDARLAKAGFSAQDRSPEGETAGDTLQFRDRLSVGRRTVGRDAGVCTRVSPNEQICTVTLVLDRGRIVALGLARDGNRTYTIPIVGGTGDYETASGTLRVSDATKAVAHYEVRLG